MGLDISSIKKFSCDHDKKGIRILNTSMKLISERQTKTQNLPYS